MATEHSPETMITARDVARWTGLAEGTLRRYRAEGNGPAWMRVGPRAVRYRAGDVADWLDAQRAGNGSGGAA